MFKTQVEPRWETTVLFYVHASYFMFILSQRKVLLAFIRSSHLRLSSRAKTYTTYTDVTIIPPARVGYEMIDNASWR